MKKNFFKKLALVLTMAMTVTTLAPAGAASAASKKIVLKSGAAAPSTVYVTKSYGLKVSGVKVKFFSSNKKVATVGMTSGTMKPVAPGSVTITAKSAKTNKTVATKKFTVNQRATSVVADQAELNLAKDATVTLKATKTPAKSTDVVKFVSSNKEVATVGLTGGKVTAKGEGEATITVYSLATKSTKLSSTMNKKATVKVYVGAVMKDFKQTNANKFDAMFAIDMKDVKASDFTITRKETNEIVAVKSATVDKDNAKKVVVETFGDVNDGKEYTVSYGKVTKDFTATDGKITKIAITPATVAFETPTKVSATLTDNNGVVIKEVAYGEGYTGLDFNIETTEGYTSGSDLVLFKVGNTAKATATYHSYKYDENGNEIDTLKVEQVITAVDKTAVTVTDKTYTVLTEDKEPDWTKAVTTENKITANDTGYFFYRILKSDKTVVTNYVLESSNVDVLLVSQASSSTCLKANLIALKEGKAYVLVKDPSNDNKVVASLEVNVVAAKKAAGIVLDKANITISNASDAAEKATIKVTVKDQYGKDMPAQTASVENLAKPAAASAPVADISIAGEVTFTGADFTTVGTYTYKVTVGDFSKTVVINAKAPTGTQFAQLILNKTSGDVVYKNADDTKDFDFTIKVGKFANGVLAGYETVAAGDVTMKLDGKAFAGFTVANNTVTVKGLDTTGATAIQATAGTYTFEINTNGKKLTGGFVVTNSQTKVVVNRKVAAGTAVTGADNDAIINAAFGFTYEGKDATIVVTDVINNKGESVTLASGNVVGVKEIKATVTVGTVKVPVTIAIGMTVTVA